ncbi:MAG: sulfur carrier protein ThiS, partial [Acidimicrobiales bacterium]
AAGADIVAVVRAICASSDPEGAARALRGQVDTAPAWSWIELNGEARKCPPQATVQDLLAGLHLDPAALVVERNGVIVDRQMWAEVAVGAGDKLELVHFVGGG